MERSCTSMAEASKEPGFISPARVAETFSAHRTFVAPKRTTRAGEISFALADVIAERFLRFS